MVVIGFASGVDLREGVVVVKNAAKVPYFLDVVLLSSATGKLHTITAKQWLH